MDYMVSAQNALASISGTPAYVGAATIGGLYIARYARGSSAPLEWNTLAVAAGVAVASAAVAPGITARLICPHSPSALLVKAASSAAVSWAGIAVLSNMDDANMFVPIQFGAYLAGDYAAKYVLVWQAEQEMKKAAPVAKTESGGIP